MQPLIALEEPAPSRIVLVYVLAELQKPTSEFPDALLPMWIVLLRFTTHMQRLNFRPSNKDDFTVELIIRIDLNHELTSMPHCYQSTITIGCKLGKNSAAITRPIKDASKAIDNRLLQNKLILRGHTDEIVFKLGE